MHNAVTEQSICKANSLFWEQMLAMRLEPIQEFGGHGALAEADPIEDPAGRFLQAVSSERCIGPAHVVGGCELSGVWFGSIEVRLTPGLAREATAAMLMQSAEAVQPEDTLDATKEIANMIAGTLKSALPRPCTMTVPWAEFNANNFCVLPRTADTVSVFFRHAKGEFMVLVRETAVRSPDGVPAAPETPAQAM